MSFGELVVASWAGMRGVVSLGSRARLAVDHLDRRGLSAPPYHLVSHVLRYFHHAGATGSFLALGSPANSAVEETDSDFESEAVARSTLLEELVAEIDNLIEKEENLGYRESLERWRIHYQDRLRALKGRIALPAEIKRYTAGKDRDLLSKLMDHSRRRLATMRRRGLISEEVRRRIEYDFDMEEQRLKQVLARLERG